jgi:hypothetical protein
MSGKFPQWKGDRGAINTDRFVRSMKSAFADYSIYTLRGKPLDPAAAEGIVSNAMDDSPNAGDYRSAKAADKFKGSGRTV